MKITIMGPPGCGKSTLAKLLAKRLRFKHYSGGDFRRKIAKERGMTISELNALGEREFWTDKEIDDILAGMEKKEDNFVVDGHMAWHFIPSSIKIFITADEKIRAQRILERNAAAEAFNSIQEAIKSMRERAESDKRRYMKYYGVNHYDQSHYDIILDNTDKTMDELLEEALKKIKEFGE